MYTVAIFGTNISSTHFDSISKLLDKIKAAGFNLYIYESFHKLIKSGGIDLQFDTYSNFDSINPDFIFSLGGDGTFLKCSHLFYRYQVPILGINFGKLGFLAEVTPECIENIIFDLQENKFSICERSLLDYSLETESQTKYGIALNELSLQKSNILKLIKINTFIDDNFLSSFWADGIIISTPTGSTGYSLSLGGPIITPDSKSFIINAIAPHTLSVRPIIIPDTSIITIQAEGEYTNFLLSNDYKSTLIDTKPKITIRKSNIYVKTLQLHSLTFFDTLRKKLNWGIDIRK